MQKAALRAGLTRFPEVRSGRSPMRPSPLGCTTAVEPRARRHRRRARTDRAPMRATTTRTRSRANRRGERLTAMPRRLVRARRTTPCSRTCTRVPAAVTTRRLASGALRHAATDPRSQPRRRDWDGDRGARNRGISIGSHRSLSLGDLDGRRLVIGQLPQAPRLRRRRLRRPVNRSAAAVCHTRHHPGAFARGSCCAARPAAMGLRGPDRGSGSRDQRDVPLRIGSDTGFGAVQVCGGDSLCRRRSDVEGRPVDLKDCEL